jgi:hypothetical protein
MSGCVEDDQQTREKRARELENEVERIANAAERPAGKVLPQAEPGDDNTDPDPEGQPLPGESPLAFVNRRGREIEEKHRGKTR